jgi:hypothetical protein
MTDHLDEAMDKACALLIEHCDNVRIFVSTLEADSENARTTGRGSWHAQCWQVHKWLQVQEQDDGMDEP